MQPFHEFDDLVEQAQNQDTYDEESGLELHDVLEQAGDEGVDLDSMEEGEIATFEAVSAYSARSTQQVTICLLYTSDAVTEHFQKKEDADRVAADCMERMCEVEKDDVKEKTVRPYAPYSPQPLYLHLLFSENAL